MNERKKYFLSKAEEIKNLGYKVYVVDDDLYNYGYIINDKDEVGYFQLGDFGHGVSFGTMHKPCGHFGTGFSMDKWDELPEKITKEVVNRVFIHHPSWVDPYEARYLDEIVKYTEETLLKSTWGKDLKLL